MSILVWKEDATPNYLCFTAEVNSSEVALRKYNSPAVVSLEYSTNGTTWNPYTIWTLISLPTVWDKVYFRNTSTTNTQFSTSWWDYYYFDLIWRVSASWDITTLVNKNWTQTIWQFCFIQLFWYQAWLVSISDLNFTEVSQFALCNMFCWCTNLVSATWEISWIVRSNWCESMFDSCSSLVSVPTLSATEIFVWSYQNMFAYCSSLETPPEIWAEYVDTSSCYMMFRWCSSLKTLPQLKALSLRNCCYQSMFLNCTNIKLSTTQTWPYQIPYRIPSTWTWTYQYWNELSNMFDGTGWTFTGTPAINTTYYLYE